METQFFFLHKLTKNEDKIERLKTKTKSSTMWLTLKMSSWGLGGGGWEVGIWIGWVDSLNGLVSVLFRLRGLRALRMLKAMPEKTTIPAVLAMALSLESVPAAPGFDIEFGSFKTVWSRTFRFGGLFRVQTDTVLSEWNPCLYYRRRDHARCWRVFELLNFGNGRALKKILGWQLWLTYNVSCTCVYWIGCDEHIIEKI